MKTIDKNKVPSDSALGYVYALQIIFIILKVEGKIKWSMELVLLPVILVIIGHVFLAVFRRLGWVKKKT